MNKSHAAEIASLKGVIGALLKDHGWSAVSGTAFAAKQFITAVGEKSAHVYLQDWGTKSENFVLAGEYFSEGRNCLESSSVLIPRSAAEAAVRNLVNAFVAGVEDTVASTYAMRLMRA